MASKSVSFLHVKQMTWLCKYKDIFGKPNEGIHSIRLLNIAIVDLGLTMLVALAISYFGGITYWKVLLLLLLLGILMHRLFCVRTTIDKLLFSDDESN